MDHLFLDANVLFSAAYRSSAGLLRLWNLKNVILCSSHYALEEARINLSDDAQRGRLERLARKIQLFDSTARQLPAGISLPKKIGRYCLPLWTRGQHISSPATFGTSVPISARQSKGF